MIKEQTSPYKVGDESINNYFKGKVTHAVNVRTHNHSQNCQVLGFIIGKHVRTASKDCLRCCSSNLISVCNA